MRGRSDAPVVRSYVGLAFVALAFLAVFSAGFTGPAAAGVPRMVVLEDFTNVL